MNNISALNYTNHAKKRINQRGIPYSVVDFILSYGECIDTYDKTKHFINKNTLKYLKEEYPSFISKHEKQLKNTAVGCGHNAVVTVMKITKKIRREYAY